MLNWVKKTLEQLFRQIGPPLLVLILAGGGLEAIVRGAQISFTVLPPPSVMVGTLFKYFISDLLGHYLVTLKVIMIGFAVGVPLGIFFAALISEFRILEITFSPYVIIFVTTPLIVLVPLFRMWLGFGSNVRAIVVVLQTIPIVTLNAIAGFTEVERDKLNLMRSLGASRFQAFIKVIFPNALSSVFTGIKLGAIFSTIATVSTGFASAGSGLGSRIVLYSGYVETPLVFACILLIAFTGISLYYTIDFIQNIIVTWS